MVMGHWLFDFAADFAYLLLVENKKDTLLPEVYRSLALRVCHCYLRFMGRWIVTPKGGELNGASLFF